MNDDYYEERRRSRRERDDRYYDEPYGEVIDDPSCIYYLACASIFLWWIGAIGICALGCGRSIPRDAQRMQTAFRVLVFCATMGFALEVLWFMYYRGYLYF